MDKTTDNPTIGSEADKLLAVFWGDQITGKTRSFLLGSFQTFTAVRALDKVIAEKQRELEDLRRARDVLLHSRDNRADPDYSPPHTPAHPEGGDLYKRIAAKIFRVDESLISAEQREFAKAKFWPIFYSTRSGGEPSPSFGEALGFLTEGVCLTLRREFEQTQKGPTAGGPSP